MFCPGMIAVLSINPVRPRHAPSTKLLELPRASQPGPGQGCYRGQVMAGLSFLEISRNMRPGPAAAYTSCCLLKTEHLFLISTNTHFFKILTEYSTLDVLFK